MGSTPDYGYIRRGGAIIRIDLRACRAAFNDRVNYFLAEGVVDHGRITDYVAADCGTSHTTLHSRFLFTDSPERMHLTRRMAARIILGLGLRWADVTQRVEAAA